MAQCTQGQTREFGVFLSNTRQNKLHSYIKKKGRGVGVERGNELQCHNYNSRFLWGEGGEVLRQFHNQQNGRGEVATVAVPLRRSQQACFPRREDQVSLRSRQAGAREQPEWRKNVSLGVGRRVAALRQAPPPTAGCWWACRRRPGSCRYCAGWCSGW